MSSPGRAALVLHTHMPYVEGFGTWPFGEEWLWEAVATSYLPLADLLDSGAPLTLSLTPVCADQLEAPGAMERCAAFLREVRPASHRLDAEAFEEAGEPELAAEIERAAAQYEQALGALEACDGDVLGRLGRHAAWTSSATHAILPLLATDAGIRLQVRTGVDSHRRRFGDGWRGGFWIPECAFEPRLAGLLEEAGVRASCVELTAFVPAGDRRHLQPLRTDEGPLMAPIDRELIDFVWGRDGYPSGAAYRDNHHRTTRDHRPWANDGSVYDPDRALARARGDAADFASRVADRIGGGGLCTLAFDTELFGLWWHEGVEFLAALVGELEAQGVELVRLDDALATEKSAPWPSDIEGATSWGAGGRLKTWSGPAVADIAFALRAAELDLLAAGERVTKRAVRELLAVQSSDWAFMVDGDLAGPYPRERLEAHLAALQEAIGPVPSGEESLRNLAPDLSLAPIFEP
jgi:1,4-alpha-glucan branching enzyme